VGSSAIYSRLRSSQVPGVSPESGWPISPHITALQAFGQAIWHVERHVGSGGLGKPGESLEMLVGEQEISSGKLGAASGADENGLRGARKRS